MEESRSATIPKLKQRKVSELRPIALTNTLYKGFTTAAIKNKLENHIEENDGSRETQEWLHKRWNSKKQCVYIKRLHTLNLFKQKHH